jgi:2-dehydropantoate 2-reductase
LGAVLADAAAGAGHHVELCVRTPVPHLVLVRDGEELTPAVTVVVDPAGVGGPADVVFVAVKATDTAGAAGWLAALCGAGTVVVAVQNGLDHRERLAPHVPVGTTVVPGLAYLAAERLGDGRVRHLSGDLLVVPDDAEAVVTAAVGAGGLRVQGRADMLSAAWRKLLGNLVANPITALTMRRIDVMGDPGIGDLARGLLAEAVAVGRAEGADLTDDDIEAVVAGTARYGPGTGSSMLYDRLAGRPLEHQYLTGEVVRRAAARGMAVPLNAAVLALLDALDRGPQV